MDVTGNALTGTIPSSFAALTAVTALALAQNQFNGTLPFASLTGLGYALLRGLWAAPDHSCAEPRRICVLCSLFALHRSLNVSGNPIYTAVPAVLSGLTRLSVLDLSSCELIGTVPVWLSGLLSLTALSLANNALTGTVTSALNSLTRLSYVCLRTMTPKHANSSMINIRCCFAPPSLPCRVLALNDNQLTGTVPGGLTARFPVPSYSWSHNCIAGSSNQSTGCSFSELGALVELYTATNGPLWSSNTGWLQASTSPCYWFGVECDSSNSTVTYVKLAKLACVCTARHGEFFFCFLFCRAALCHYLIICWWAQYRRVW